MLRFFKELLQRIWQGMWLFAYRCTSPFTENIPRQMFGALVAFFLLCISGFVFNALAILSFALLFVFPPAALLGLGLMFGAPVIMALILGFVAKQGAKRTGIVAWMLIFVIPIALHTYILFWARGYEVDQRQYSASGQYIGTQYSQPISYVFGEWGYLRSYTTYLDMIFGYHDTLVGGTFNPEYGSMIDKETAPPPLPPGLPNL